MSMRTISQAFIEALLTEAEQSERKRAIFRLHEHHEPVQRMFNALLPGTYVTPHKHENPDKVELVAILIGRIAVVQFKETGAVEAAHVMDAEGTTKIVDIPPRVYHCMVALAPSVMLEIIQGPYDAATHKKFAPWAPLEGTAETSAYLRGLEAEIRTRRQPEQKD